MKTLTPQSWVQSWQTAMGTAGAAYTAGTANPRRNPMAAAATPEAMAAWLTGVQNSQQKRIAKLNATPLTAYVNGCAQKGAANLATGARLATAKATAAANIWVPVYAAMAAASAAIPKIKGNEANAVQRATAAIHVAMQAKAAQLGLAGVA